MQLDRVFEFFYANYQAHNMYSAYNENRWLQNIEGYSLMALGRFNLAVETEQEVKSLQKLYFNIISDYAKAKSQILLAYLFYFRGREVLDKDSTVDYEEFFEKCYFDLITSHYLNDETGKHILTGNVQEKALGYVYLLQKWVLRISSNYGHLIFSQTDEWYAKFFMQEFQFLDRIKDIPFIEEGAYSKLFSNAFDTCYYFYKVFQAAGKKDLAIKSLEISLVYNEYFKKHVGRGTGGCVENIKLLKELSGK